MSRASAPRAKAAGERRRFFVQFCVEVEVAQAVFDAVLTDEWRKRFYALHSPADVAEHLAYNLVQGRSLDSLDGFADQDPQRATIGPIDIEEVGELDPNPRPERTSKR